MFRTCSLGHLSVGLSVGLSVWKVYCGKTADGPDAIWDGEWGH